MPKAGFDDMIQKFAYSIAVDSCPKFDSKRFNWHEPSTLRGHVFAMKRRPMLSLHRPIDRNGKERTVCISRTELAGLEAILPELKKELERCAGHIRAHCKEGVRPDEEDNKAEAGEDLVVQVPLRSLSVGVDDSAHPPAKKPKKSRPSGQKRKIKPLIADTEEEEEEDQAVPHRLAIENEPNNDE